MHRLMLRLFVCGDVMLGRGIDQLFKLHCDPQLYESFVKDARYYIPPNMEDKSYTKSYVWGELLSDPLFKQADARIINLETSITTSADHQDKAVLYKMHPANIEILTVAHINYCHLANNHVGDWGLSGLLETIQTLDKSNVVYGGVGQTHRQALAPKFLTIGDKRLAIFSYGDVSSGVPATWIANVNVIDIAKPGTKEEVVKHIRSVSADFYLLSIHWGSNWGFDVPAIEQEFAHYLIDEGGVDLIHGHSSHHFRPLEIYRHKLIMYGCGDLINDYEIIASDPQYLSHISLAYYLSYDWVTRKFSELVIHVYQMHRLQLISAADSDKSKVVQKLNEICYPLSFTLINGSIYLHQLSGGYLTKYLKYKEKYLSLKKLINKLDITG